MLLQIACGQPVAPRKVPLTNPANVDLKCRLLLKPPPTIIRSASFQFLSFKNRRTTTASSWANDSMALAHGQKGRAASSGGSLKSGMQSPLLRGFAKSLLHVACGLVGSPLRLVKLALGLHFLVAGYLTGSVL